jgi:NADH-ubiquinone oxidoreductase chain 5
MFIAGINALGECDLKKIIALSTLRQLGVIIFRISIGFPMFGFFHLVTHAIFKALLFICAGVLIDLHGHRQDLRRMGNLSIQIPLTMGCILRANLALCAFPFIAGFYSKDLIIEMCVYSNVNLIIVMIVGVATGMTLSYRVRLSFYTMWGENIGGALQNVEDENINCVIYLIFGAVIMGRGLN